MYVIMPNLIIVSGVKLFRRYHDISILNLVAVCHLVYISSNSHGHRVQKADKTLCIDLPNFIEIGIIVLRYHDLFDFQDGGLPPSWILEIAKFHWLTWSGGYGSPEGTCTHFILIRSLELLIRGNELVIRGNVLKLSLIHIWRCRRSTLCRSRWSPYH